MTKIYTLLLLCLFALTLPVTAREAEFKKIKESWTLQADGTQVYRQSKVLTLYTHTAMNRTYGESFITYDPRYQTLQIHESYTRQKDGNIVKTPANALVEVLPSAAANAPAFNALREMVVVHTGLELGATIYLDYSITTKPGYLPGIQICRLLEHSSPVKEYEISITVPRGQHLEYALNNHKAKASVTESEGMKQVSWTLKNLPALSREPQVSVIGGDLPLLIATTEEKPLSFLTSQWQPEGDAGIRALAGKLTAGAKDDKEKVTAIRDYVIDNLYYSSLPLAESGYRIRPAAEVIRSAYGTEAEKANLMAALLKAAGLKAGIGAVCAPSENTASLGVGSIRELFVWTDAGGSQQALSLKGKTPSAVSWQKDYAYVASLTQPFELNLPPVTLRKDYALQPDAANAKDGYLVFTLPVERGSLAGSQYVRFNSKRTSNLLLPGLADESFTYTVDTPAGMEPVTRPMEKKMDNAVGTLTISIRPEGAKTRVIRSLKLKKQMIRPADYAAFRQLMTEYGAVDGLTLVYRKPLP